VLNLLSHTSGLAHPTWNAKLYQYLQSAGLSVSELSGTRRVFEMPLVCDPGVEFNYGISGDWIGPLIEAVTGRPFQVVICENVLEPLDMYDTVVQRSVEQLERSVSVHVRDPDDHWGPTASSYYGEGVSVPEVYPAGGCLYSTAVDFLRLQLVLLGGGSRDGTRLLRAESVNELFRNQIGSLDVGVLRTEIPAASDDIHLEGWKWGLGMLVNENAGPDGRSPGSGGWGGGWNTFFWIDRSKGLVAGMYTQTAPFYDPGVIRCYRAFEALASS
jgi:CubicO group peptidase (beta-lactamase class C family)